MKTINSLAFDLGASSGRLMLSSFNGEKIELQEIYRFPNEPVRIGSRIYWDILRLYHEMKTGLKKAASMGIEAQSVGIDTWGVDYGLLDKDGNLIGNTINYRDDRTDGIMEKVDTLLPLKDIYSSTGIQFMNFNTIFQLYSDKLIRPDILEKAKTFLMIPDLLGYFFTGEKFNEYTNLSTTQLLDAREKKLDSKILNTLGIDSGMFCGMVSPGSIIGGLSNEIFEETGLNGMKFIAVGSHDTASAVAGTPTENGSFLSCGTWSLLGLELDEPIISDASYSDNFTNEGGVENKIRFLKNINGLWIIQQLRKSYSEHHKEVSFPDIIEAVKAAKNKSYCINPEDKVFTAPFNMYREVIQYCAEAGQGTPENLGEAAMAVYNGLTKEYKANIERLEKLTEKNLDSIHMVGGGIKDEFLCQLTADVTGKKVVTGPIEASVLGNVIMQLKATGIINSLAEGREVIKNSFGQKEYSSSAM